ncbi:hypothetical protein GGX14DRAFT_384588 [Mycena pura]|uniref:Uncharacterized protein n=1 Tax=Mycena pura TaxID=153505 RepID=A0AAD7E704_9AGAR|nr:hypothetical protein GGX14DRAFT_384588 [Mycena pura]
MAWAVAGSRGHVGGEQGRLAFHPPMVNPILALLECQHVVIAEVVCVLRHVARTARGRKRERGWRDQSEHMWVVQEWVTQTQKGMARQQGGVGGGKRVVRRLWVAQEGEMGEEGGCMGGSVKHAGKKADRTDDQNPDIQPGPELGRFTGGGQIGQPDVRRTRMIISSAEWLRGCCLDHTGLKRSRSGVSGAGGVTPEASGVVGVSPEWKWMSWRMSGGESKGGVNPEK